MNHLVICIMPHKPTMSKAWVTRRINLMFKKIRFATALSRCTVGSMIVDVYADRAMDDTKATIQICDMPLPMLSMFVNALEKIDNLKVIVVQDTQT